jgi:hypothetical protein
MRITITKEQEIVLLKHFSEEPWPYEWSQQDISVQFRNYLHCGHFEKPIEKGCCGPSTIPDGEPF